MSMGDSREKKGKNFSFWLDKSRPSGRPEKFDLSSYDIQKFPLDFPSNCQTHMLQFSHDEESEAHP